MRSVLAATLLLGAGVVYADGGTVRGSIEIKRTKDVAKDESVTIGEKYSQSIGKGAAIQVGENLTIQAGNDVVIKNGSASPSKRPFPLLIIAATICGSATRGRKSLSTRNW